MSLPALLAAGAFWLASMLLAFTSDQRVCVLEDPLSHKPVKVLVRGECPPPATQLSED